MKRTVYRVMLFAALALLLALFALPAAAHEGRDVGPYTLYFGWRAEPAYVGYFNGPEVYIELRSTQSKPGRLIAPLQHGDDHHDDPMESLAIDLQVEVSFGSATRTLRLEPNYGTTDHYIAVLIPTRPGDYTFRLFGTIGDTVVDEVFTSSAGMFSTIEPVGDVTFPDELPSLVELLERIAALEARLAALEG
jgi:hypothetical protein